MDIKETVTGNNGQQIKRKVQMPSIDQILTAVKQRGYFNAFRRYRYEYDVADALQLIEAIGKSRNPRFVIDEENRHAYENFVKWCHGDNTMRAIDPATGAEVPGRMKSGIYIAGNTGSGKSWCLEIMQAYAAALRLLILYDEDKEPRPLWWRIARADAICEEYTKNGDMMVYKKQPMLGIQDLGAEPAETLYMGNRVDVVRQLIEYRGDYADRLTFITSNLKLGGEALRTRYGDRVQSRLGEMCNYLVIHGKDRRKY